MSSIGGTTVTYQSLVALRDSKGMAIPVSTSDAKEAQHSLARHGFYAKLSSAAALAGVKTLVGDGQFSAADRVVLIVTSHGYKEMVGPG